MINLITGHKGFLGETIARKFGQSGASKLNYNRSIRTLYPELNMYKNKTVQIIHCGASSNRNNINMNLYKDNWSAVKELVLFAKENKSRIIFISANSISRNGCKTGVSDLYSHLKNEGESLISRTLPTSQYAIIRLPGLYEKNKKRSGFLDQIFYGNKKDPKKYVIKSKNMFNNLLEIADATEFIYKIASLESLPGFIGSCGTYTSLPMHDICEILISFKASIKDKLEFEDENICSSSEYDISSALEYGLKQRDIVERLHYLYGS